MDQQIITQLQNRIINRFFKLCPDDKRNAIRNVKITADDWLFMHRLRNLAFREGIIRLDEFQLLNSWLGIDENYVNGRVVTFRILVIGTFQHISRRLYEEKVLID